MAKSIPIVAAANGKRALMQGQGFENVGEQTLFWYAPWPEAESDGVRVATWERDRLGYFRAFQGRSMAAIQEAHFVSAPIDLEGRSAQLFLNLDGISAHSGVNVEIVDEKFNKLAGYGAEVCIAPTTGGFEQAVRWQEQESIHHASSPIRLRVNFMGERPEDVRLFALYLRDVVDGAHE